MPMTPTEAIDGLLAERDRLLHLLGEADARIATDGRELATLRTALADVRRAMLPGQARVIAARALRGEQTQGENS